MNPDPFNPIPSPYDNREEARQRYAQSWRGQSRAGAYFWLGLIAVLILALIFLD